MVAWLMLVGADAQEGGALPGSEECVACHEDSRRAGEREEGMPPPFDAAALRASPHAVFECNNCHVDLMEVEYPHPEKLERVDCGMCHSEVQAQFEESLHGRAAQQGDRLAPLCKDCHGAHNVLRSSDAGSPISTMEIPRLCGRCHREGTSVSLTRQIHQDNILDNYVDSIHGEGLFRKGLTVTAVCTSCHTTHFVLPHTDPRSSISRQNIPKTCTTCHAQIEAVAVVIGGTGAQKDARF